ncbi:hypothetical protein [Planococcus sp. MB-3u-03]|uniref:hypothetical protein n=1 Tax=Planococcus sp. MB-3u-03 TaxID=2058136 RepID=UPI0012FEFAD7|nr:hypothetical protein [Planococcus sp. MB-3u-03]
MKNIINPANVEKPKVPSHSLILAGNPLMNGYTKINIAVNPADFTTITFNSFYIPVQLQYS